MTVTLSAAFVLAGGLGRRNGRGEVAATEGGPAGHGLACAWRVVWQGVGRRGANVQAELRVIEWVDLTGDRVAFRINKNNSPHEQTSPPIGVVGSVSSTTCSSKEERSFHGPSGFASVGHVLFTSRSPSSSVLGLCYAVFVT